MQMSQQLEIGLQSTPSQNVVNIYQFQKIGGGNLWLVLAMTSMNLIIVLLDAHTIRHNNYYFSRVHVHVCSFAVDKVMIKESYYYYYVA